MRGIRGPHRFTLGFHAACAICAAAVLFSACRSDRDRIASIVVTVPVGSLAAIDDTAQLTATALNRRGDAIAGVEFTWASSAPGIVSVDANGVVTARDNGAANITATTNSGKTGAGMVHVRQVPVAVEISPDAWTSVWVGARRQFSAVATDANGHPIDTAEVLWTTSDDSVVRIDDAGLATAVAGGSDVLVTAAAEAATDSVNVTVPFEGSSGPGVMYTVWFARSDDAPALIVNGRIEVPLIYASAATTPVRPWPRNTVAKFQWVGDRIGLLTDVANGAGTFRVVDRVGEWTNLAIADAVDFQLEGNRIGLLREGGEFRVRQGINGAWTVLADSGAADFQLEGNRIGLLQNDGTFQVKDGISGAWTVLVAPGGMPLFQLAGDRIGVLSENGEFRVKDGVDGAWTILADSGAVDFRLRGNRIGLLLDDGRFLVKDGIHGAWTELASANVRQFEFEGNRIGLLSTSGEFRVKDGINGGWTVLAGSGARSFQLHGNRIGVLLDDGTLRVKTGISGAWDETPAYGPNVTQYRLIVDVPAEPHRTTTSSYHSQQAMCATQTESPFVCYHVSSFAIPVPLYGRFCGAGHPEDFSWALDQGPIDGLDRTCRHHDSAPTWYPEASDIGDAAGACVVRYALVHSRLTRDGILLTHGADDDADWDAAWNSVGMVNLKDGLDNYFIYTAVCTDAMLADFTAATASSH